MFCTYQFVHYIHMVFEKGPRNWIFLSARWEMHFQIGSHMADEFDEKKLSEPDECETK